MEPIITIVLLCTMTLVGSGIGVTITYNYISNKIDETVCKYRPKTMHSL